MLSQYLLDNPLYAVAAWAVLLTLDFFLPWVGRRILRRYADERIQPEFLRMNPVYLEKPRGFLRYLLFLVVPSLALLLTWVILRGLYLWLCGALLFTRLILVLRHKRSYSALLFMKAMPGAVEGGVRYTHAYIYRSSASDLSVSALLLALAWGVSPHPLFLGGCIALTGLAMQHWTRGRERVPELRL